MYSFYLLYSSNSSQSEYASPPSHSQLDFKVTQYIPLPCVTFRVHPRVHLLIINNAHSKRFRGSDVSNVERAFLIFVTSCCQFAIESLRQLNTHSASRSQRDWNGSHLQCPLRVVGLYVWLGQRCVQECCQWNRWTKRDRVNWKGRQNESVYAEQPWHTNDVDIVFSDEALCICSQIWYRALWILLNLQITPVQRAQL